MRGTLSAVVFLGCGVVGVCVVGCGNDVTTTSTSSSTSSSSSGSGTSSSSTSSGMGGGTPTVMRDKIDLLLAIDNSRSMDDKQAVLALTLPDLIGGFVNPPCVDENDQYAPHQPGAPTDACPDVGSHRIFAPVTDIHIGIVTSSLGGHGSDSCQPEPNTCGNGVVNTTVNDAGHLVSRKDPCSAAAVSTYENEGFLAWDPSQKDTPPGEKNLGAISFDASSWVTATTTPGLVPTARDLVIGAGAVGCGFESQLESWYRFLVDPNPYASISIDPNGKATPMGTDQVVLQERAQFLRPDSALVLVQLTDENDCSTKEYGQFYFANQIKNGNGMPFHLPASRSECAKDPNDPCCLSCGVAQGNCPPDPICQNSPQLTDATDNINLRCVNQKARFGLDFLYPLDRYTAALTAPTVKDASATDVPNPIFNGSARTPKDVFYAAIVGVPWQDLANDPTDATKGFKNAAANHLPDSQGHTTFDYVVGDPGKNVAPLDPHMKESSVPRSGTNPITNTSLAPPGSPDGADPINGHEYTSDHGGGPNDLEYACIFALPQPRDCKAGGSCDCTDTQNDSPLCAPNPNDGNNPTLQVRAKAYPGIRELSLVGGLKDQGIAGSICPAQTNDLNAADFAFRPSIRAILQAVAPRLARPQ